MEQISVEEMAYIVEDLMFWDSLGLAHVFGQDLIQQMATDVMDLLEVVEYLEDIYQTRTVYDGNYF